MEFKPLFPDFPHMIHGGDYNPEQWRETPEIWDEDMKLMKEANFNELTMGIFSWAEVEPREDVFDFSVLDTMMDKIYKNGGRVILATPSAARPQWLAKKYPDVLRVNEKGEREHFRARHNFCASSENYLKRVKIINEKLSQRYGSHPALLAWHLSNEYGSGPMDGFCHCEKCAAKFRLWLKNKYRCIGNLNHTWWTRFWSHRFDSFDDVEPPYTEIGNQSFYGLRLDWKRFLSDNILDFMKEEIKAVRKYSDKPVTTNGMHIYPGVNYRDFAKELDFFSQDMYPEWERGTTKAAMSHALVCDYSRGLKQGDNFIVMESAPGSVCSGVCHRKIKSSKQQILEAVKSISHGADSTMYFQWRKGRGACEKFHGAVVDHYGKSDTRIFKTVSKIGEILKKLDSVVGSKVKSDVAIAFETPVWWALGQFSKWDNGYYGNLEAFYNAFYKRNIQTDIIGYDDDFSSYKVLVIPSAYLMSEKLADKIKAYVKSGGILIATYLTAVCDENDLCTLGGVPGFGLDELFGIRCEEVDSYRNPLNIYKNYVLYNGKKYELSGNAEVLVNLGASSIASYTDLFYKDTPALCKNEYGNGTAYYMAFENNGSFQDVFIADIIDKYRLKPVIDAQYDEGICIRERFNNDTSFYFVTNETDSEKVITFTEQYTNLFNLSKLSGTQVLAPCGFLVLSKERTKK